MGYILPDLTYVKTLNTNETVLAGSITLPYATELSAVQVLLFKKGVESGSERLRCKLYGDVARTNLLYTGEWSDLQDIEDFGINWWGWVSLEFGRPHIPADLTLYVSIESDSYTRIADTYYLSLVLDWATPQYAETEQDYKGISLRIYGYRDVK